MTAAGELQQKIRSTIPLSDVMQFEIVELSDRSISVHAPLSPNVNIHGTGFAGSIYSLAVLTGWALVTHITTIRNIDCELVVSKAEIRYLRPVDGDLECRCETNEIDIDQFIDYFGKKGRSRLKLAVIVGDRQAILDASYHITSKSSA